MLEQRKKSWQKLLASIKEWVCLLAQDLERRGIVVDKVVLFGSIARGDYAEGSDADLIVVSKSWAGRSYVERLSLLYRLWRGKVDANFVALTPEELRERIMTSVVLRDAVSYWITVYTRGEKCVPE